MNRVVSFTISLWLIILPLSASGFGRFVDVIVVLDAAYAPGEHASNQSHAAEIAHSMGFNARHAYGTALFGFAARIPEGRLNGLQHDPRIAYVDLDKQVSLPIPRTAVPRRCTDNPNGPGCNQDGGSSGDSSSGQATPWGIERINAHLNDNEGAGVHVYVLDTGIDSNHEDLAPNMGNGYAAETCSAKKRTCKKIWDDDSGHGTHVSGTVGAADNSTGVIGVASKVTLHAVKVLNRSGSGSISGVIAGIDWVTGQTLNLGSATVANMSLTGSGSKSGSCTSNGFSGTDVFHEALCNARNAGVVFAVAAGNEGSDTEYSVPGAYDDTVIAVSATNASDDWPSWSNWGNNSAGWSGNLSVPVALAAPGVTVLSTKMGGGTIEMSGTSMATPHVAGAIALYMANNPQTANGTAFVNARTQLLSTAEETTGFSNSSGHVHGEDFLNSGGL